MFKPLEVCLWCLSHAGYLAQPIMSPQLKVIPAEPPKRAKLTTVNVEAIPKSKIKMQKASGYSDESPKLVIAPKGRVLRIAYK